MVFGLFKRKKNSDDARFPRWEPNIPVDRSAIVDRMHYYCNGRFRFVLFTHGTCALVKNNSSNPTSDAVDLLKTASFGHVDFNPRLMDDGNYLVGFGEHVCGVVLARELEDHGKYIFEHHLEGLRREEVLLKSESVASTFDDRGHAGLLARARLFLDAKSLCVTQVYEPTDNAG
jgi:hypothetical protein